MRKKFVGIALLALVVAGSAQAQMTIRVVDRKSQPVPSSISFLINDNWLQAGMTGPNGVYRDRRRCDGSMAIRAEPLDRSYFPSSGQLCSGNSLTVRVAQRGEPIRLTVEDYDADADGRISRAEFVGLAAGGVQTIRPVVANTVQLPISMLFVVGEPNQQALARSEIYTISIGELLAGAQEGQPAVRIPAQAVTEALSSSQGTLYPAQGSDPRFASLFNAWQALDRLEGARRQPRTVAALNASSISFTLLDRDRDGYLSSSELGNFQLVEE